MPSRSAPDPGRARTAQGHGEGGIRPTARAAAPPRPLAAGSCPDPTARIPPRAAPQRCRRREERGVRRSPCRAERGSLQSAPKPTSPLPRRAEPEAGPPPAPRPSHGTPQRRICPQTSALEEGEGIPREASGSPGDGRRSMSTFSVLMIVRVGFRSTAAFMAEAGARGPGTRAGGRLLRRGSGGQAPSSSSFLPRSLPSPSALLLCCSAPPRPPRRRRRPAGLSRGEGAWAAVTAAGRDPNAPAPEAAPGPALRGAKRSRLGGL